VRGHHHERSSIEKSLEEQKGASRIVEPVQRCNAQGRKNESGHAHLKAQRNQQRLAQGTSGEEEVATILGNGALMQHKEGRGASA